MRAIQVSDEVWQAMASRGKFGETEDDVLRRVFSLPPVVNNGQAQVTERLPDRVTSQGGRAPLRRSFATTRMSSYISGNQLVVGFAGGPERRWTLPSRDDKGRIRSVRDEAVEFASKNRATIGQQNAVRKALTENGYHLVK